MKNKNIHQNRMKILSAFICLIIIAIVFSILPGAALAASVNERPRFAIITRPSPDATVINPYPLYFTDKTQYEFRQKAEEAKGTLIAHGEFQPTQNTTGWNFFKATGSQDLLKKKQQQLSPKERLASRNSSIFVQVYRGVGILEGFLATEEIINTYLNSFFMATPPAVNNFMIENMRFIRETLCNPSVPLPANATSYGKNADDNAYIEQLCKLYAQVAGITEGVKIFIEMFPHHAPWNMHLLPVPNKFDMIDAWGLNAMASFMDYFTACNITMMMSKDENHEKSSSSIMSQLLKHKKYHTLKSTSSPQQEKYVLNQHCSALVVKTNDDIFLAHDVWSQFNMLIRKFAIINLETTIQFSGYPGIIASVDDFLTNNDNGIVVTETTFTQGNAELTQKYVTPWTTPEFLNSVIATLLAKNGAEWSRLFIGQLQDGTYANSWIILTKSLVSKSSSQTGGSIQVAPGALWLCEPLPGPYSVAQDITPIFLQQGGYWAGYNIPYAPSVFNLSGALALEQEYGSYFSFNNTARAEIFRRDHTKVTDVNSMAALMRQNKFTTDPLSIIPGCVQDGCNPVYSPTLDIAARGDLSPPNQTFGKLSQYMAGFFGPSAFGALDVKITGVFSMYNETTKSFDVLAQSGPTTFDGLPPLVLPNLAPSLQMITYGQWQGAWQFPFVQFSADRAPRNVTTTTVSPKKIFKGLF